MAAKTEQKKGGKAKFILGILIGALFLFLAFRKVDFSQMGEAFRRAKYWYVLLSVAFYFLSHWFRALRWHFLMAPIQKIRTKHLFSALVIGYMANNVTPAHLGEFLRAYVLGKRNNVRASAVFGTIVIERIIDIFTLLFLMAFTFIVFPFPDWVQKSGYITFTGVVVLLVLLVLMKRHRATTLRILGKILKPFPERISARADGLAHSFLDGVVRLMHWQHYLITIGLSVVIWACYGAVLQMCFYAFDFVRIYELPWTAALVVLVITTISVIVPSSPGYIGTYHWLCQISLGLFAIPKSEALTFAFVVHAINFLPVIIVGLVFAGREGIHISKISR
jgi:uncharacterized protein (TIRG00374 family)